MLSFNTKSESKFGNCFFAIPYLEVALNCHYLSNELTLDMDVIVTIC